MKYLPLFVLTIFAVGLLLIAMSKSNSRITESDIKNFRLNVDDLEFLTGNSMRDFADFRITERDGSDPIVMTSDLNFSALTNGSIIFVRADYIGHFFIATRHFRTTFVLITHNSDYSMPGQGPFRQLLDNPLLMRWFAMNTDFRHRLLTTIPIGIRNSLRSEMNAHLDAKGETTIANELLDIPQFQTRKTLMLINFSVDSDKKRKVRVEALAILKRIWPSNKTGVVYRDTMLDHSKHLRRLRDVKFVVSPPGHGIDCHRTWEALIMGCVPIALNTTISSLYINQPILVVNDWNEVTEKRLTAFEQKLRFRLTDGVVRTEIVKAKYWKTIIARSRFDNADPLKPPDTNIIGA